MKDSNASILLAGDICPTKDTESFFDRGGTDKLFNNVLNCLNKADLRIANLEFPLTNIKKGILKTGPILRGDEHFVNVLKNANFDILSLANNHIKDCGEQGVIDTLRVCKEHQINTVGAGKNLKKAKEPLIKIVNNIKIGFMTFAEQEFNTASEDTAGANYLDIYYDFDEVKKLKKEVDYLIILYHGGIEYYKYPSPLLQKKCRKLVECGADLVSCQHSHCIGTFEDYEGGKIIYGQGNTIFGYRKNKPSWNEGLLVKIEITKNLKGEITSSIDYDLIEAIMNGGITLSDDLVKEKRLELFEKDSQQLNEQFIKASWEKFCKERIAIYYSLLFGFQRFLIHFNRLLNNKFVNLLYTKKRKITSHNIVRCEAHNEVLMSILDIDNAYKRRQ